MTHPVACHVLTAVALAATLTAQGAETDGAVAPANRWYTAGGSASHSGISRSRPLRGDPRPAWQITAKGEIEGEPLVWDDLVVFAEARDQKQRRLHVIRLFDGKQRCKPVSLRTTQPLCPSMWSRSIVLRHVPDGLRHCLIGSRLLVNLRSRKFRQPVGPPLVFRDEVYAVIGGHLHRLQLPYFRTAWRSQSGGYVGRPALLGDRVHAAQMLGATTLLMSHARSSGRIVASRVVGPSKQLVAGANAFVAARGRFLALYTAGASELVALRKPNTVFIDLKRPHVRSGPGYNGVALRSLGAAALLGDRWLAMFADSKSKPVLFHSVADPPASSRGKLYGRHLATTRYKPEFVRTPLTPTVAGNVAYLGGRAFDHETGKILWRLAIDTDRRVVPARETLLVVESRDKLTALRSGRTMTTATPARRATYERATAVLRDGSIVVGPLEVKANGTALMSRPKAKKPESVALSDVLYVQDGSGTPAHWDRPEDAARAFDLLVGRRIHDDYVALSKRAAATNDAAFIESVLAACRRAGVAEAKTKLLRARLASLARRKKKANAKLVGELKKSEAGIEARAVRSLWPTVEASGRNKSPLLHLTLLRSVLDRDPKHPDAIAAVRKLLPEGLRGAKPFHALDWLAFLRSTQETPIQIMGGDKPDFKNRDQLELLDLRTKWRKDLAGVQSRSLVVYSPLKTPGSIARCLSMGELVCGTLDGLFKGFVKMRKDERRMRLHLFESRKEYLKESGKRGAGHLQWTAGHYDPVASVSRMFLPAGEDAFRRVMGVFAHELTHQWLRDRCPALPYGAPGHPALPGYWIVEGFASLVEEFRFDLAARRVETQNPRSRHLDILAHVPKGQLHSWRRVLGWSHVEFAKMTRTKQKMIPVECGWRLGSSFAVDAIGLFYTQSAGVCQYLFHAENGKYRRKLLDYVIHYYKASAKHLDPEKAFGMSANELGAKAVAYAKNLHPGR